MASNLDWLNQPAPENYVAGLGRGATGFTTRSDLGPARSGPSEDQIKDALARRAAVLSGEQREEDNDDDDRFQDPDNEVGLFASAAYDREDDEADQIYQAVDERMEKRRKQQREDRERKETEDYERKNPKIQQQFADLKRALGTVSDEDWASIPDVGDMTGKNKRVKRDNQANRRFYAVPDSVIANAGAQGQYDTSIESDAPQANADAANGDNADGTRTNFADIGRARDKVLQVRLDQAAQGSSSETGGGTSTSIDPKGYLTSLTKSTDFAGEAQVGDVKRVRSLLESVIKTNPKHAPGWIAAARLEEVAGKQVAARNVMARGCENCPRSEDAWLENIRLNEKHNAKIIAATALKHNKESVNLWLAALNLEDEPRAKKRIIRQAIDHIPSSVLLWKEAVNLEEDQSDARLMLAKATELIPLSVELWLALARLESADNARKVLNKARKAIPASHEVWLAAARLQEQTSEAAGVDGVLRTAVKALVKAAAMLKREDWISEAENAEDEGFVLVSEAIVHQTIGYDLETDGRKQHILLDDAKKSINRGKFTTARAIYAYATKQYPDSGQAWKAAVDLEKNHGSKEALWNILDRATKACPGIEELWIRYMREIWSTGDLEAARTIIQAGFHHNTNSETLWLAAVKLESDAGQVDRARELLAPARSAAGTDRVWIKSITFERAQGNTAEALDLALEGVLKYPKIAKIHMQKGQIYQIDHKPPLLKQAREAYSTGVRECPNSGVLWVLGSRLEEEMGAVVKARSLLERARKACPTNAQVWLESVRVELRAGSKSGAQHMMSRALQAVPAAQSGILWAERIWHLEERKQRKPVALEAIKKVESSPVMFVTIARIFWAERRLEKAAAWFEKAIVVDADYGDTWAWYMKFLTEHGTPEKREDVVKKCVNVEPRHGEIWASTRKDPLNSSKGIEKILRMVVDRLS